VTKRFETYGGCARGECKMWDRAHTKKVKQGHVTNRESVGSSLKIGEWRVLGGGVFSLSQHILTQFAFWQVSTEIV
jgi:hypothetical protein